MKKIYFLIFTTIFISCNSLETDVEKACELSCKKFEDVSKLQLLNLKFAFDSIENNNIINLKNDIELATLKISEIRNKHVDKNSNELTNISYDSLLLNKCQSCFSSVLKKYGLSKELISKEIEKHSAFIIEEIYNQDEFYNDGFLYQTKGPINLRRTEKFKKRDYEVKIDTIRRVKPRFQSFDFDFYDYNSQKEKGPDFLDMFYIAAERHNFAPKDMLVIEGQLIIINSEGCYEQFIIGLYYNTKTYEWKLGDFDINEIYIGGSTKQDCKFPSPFPNNTLINNPKLIGETLGEYIAAEITEEAWAVDYFKNDSFETDIEFAWEGEIHNDTLHSQDNRWKYKGIINVTNNGFLPSAYSRSYSYGVDILFRDDYWSWKLFKFPQ